MPKPLTGPEPDPMARVVDRLLAQLPGLQGAPVYSHVSSSKPSAAVIGAATVRRQQDPSLSELIGVWIRVFLGLSLGVMLSAWPYSTACGFPLFGYFITVCTIVLAGVWAAAAAWRLRTGLPHIVALVLVVYGMTLAAAELLPRTGYAVDRATWLCEEGSG